MPRPRPTATRSPLPVASRTPVPTQDPSPTLDPVRPAPVIPEDADPSAKADGHPWGVDISAYQHPNGAPVKWAAAFSDGPATTPFAFIKTSEGMSSDSNPYAAADRVAARTAGALVGTYHYAKPSLPVTDTALAQARFAASVYGGKASAGMLPLALDLESNPNGLSRTDLAQWALTFLAEVNRITGRTPLLYTYPGFFAEHVDPDPAFARYPLWIANYGRDLNSPKVPDPWTSWTFWQFSSKGNLDGISGGVDLNVFGGTGASLSLMAGVLPRPKGVAVGAPVSGTLAGQALLDGLLTRPTPTS